MESDDERVRYIDEIKEFARAKPGDQIGMIKGNDKLKEVAEDKLLVDVLSQGSFEFSPKSMGLYIHSTPHQA